jgi:tetratricopeptide (TPR) repeat protein
VSALGCDPISSVVTELLAAGVEHHRAGRLAEAEACYRRVLAAQPSHFEAYSNLGNALREEGKLAAGASKGLQRHFRRRNLGELLTNEQVGGV